MNRITAPQPPQPQPEAVDPYAEFTVKPSTRNILEITVENRWDIPDAEFASLRAVSTRTVDIKTEGMLNKRIAEYIHIRTLDYTPVSRAMLNRRFGQIARRHGFSILEALGSLMLLGKIIEIRYGAKIGVCSKSVYEVQRAVFDENAALGTPHWAWDAKIMENLE